MGFSKKILVIFVSFFFVAQSFAADSEGNPYVVEDVAVSVSAKSPTEARNLAVKTVRRDALLILLARLSIDTATTGKISDDEVMDMVRSEQIVDEKIAGSTYSATFNVTFAKDFVEHILAQKDLAKTEEKPVAVEEKRVSLIVPVKILQRKILLWEGSNDWRVAVNKALDGDAAFKIPVADADNVAIINLENVNKISVNELAPLFSKYQSNNAYFLLFSHDSISGKASVMVRGLSKDDVSQVKLTFLNSEKLEGQELMNKVAVKTVEYLQGINSEARAQNRSEQNVSLEIPITKLGDWLMIKNKLESSGFVAKINIDAISCDYVKASILVASADSNLVELFARSGFSLTAKNSGLYLLTIK